ncbi:hypothetical protein RhiirA4_453541 [Rhizophagus irregularis]|uniref:Uncharacterized protein n=1 Tax=Rhizophagus irregularis TaxID=588596 RepID=A0A2I1G0R4_9GLOM|nr:hypothetical protein RhiirA4_453541 [Rhizophagus irregularis]
MSKNMIYDITNSQPPTGNTEYSSSILSTVPERNAVIIPGANQITITYKMNDIKPSIGYITISQKNTIEGGDDFLRTKISANNSKSITIIGSEVRVTLEDYVFDRGNTTYIFKIDDDFVEVNGQNLTGSSWEVSTAPGSGSNEPGDTRATILLTPAGTKNYLENRNIYIYEMSKEISKALAIEEDIKDTKTPDQPSSFALRHSLDKIIISKSTSAIPIGTRTSDLDPNYGAPENLHLWRKYRYILIGVIIGLFLLRIIWFVARNKFPKGRNFSTIIFYPLILVDFVLDMIVLGVHGRDLKWFYICSLVFLSVPILLKIIISWLILENESNNSRHWRKRAALIFMLLSWIDLEALNVLTSRCAAIGALDARFAEETQKRIDNSIVTIVFIEDVQYHN